MNTVEYAYTKKKKQLKLSLLGTGGEGSVYEILGYPNRVAKIYHSESANQRDKREEKIDAMVAINNSFVFKNANLSNDIAWPLSPLYDKNGTFIGFGMNRIITTTELDDLYVYPTKNNSSISIKERLICLISLCDVVERLHRIGKILVGDFNPNNIKIKPDWTVSFVDADSYQINDGEKDYRCIVCAPGYVAPELITACKNSTYADCKSTTFTKETDLFALAIHIFRMLMNGCHPYICERHLNRVGSAPAPKSIDKRVENGETPFFKKIPNYVAPQYAPNINDFPQYLYDLFYRAFVDGHTNPLKRPTHFYWKEKNNCPYCAADNRYIKKMGIVPTKNNISKTSTNSSRKNYNCQAKQVASAKTKTASSHTNSTKKGSFWIVSIAISIIIQILLGMYILPDIYKEVFNNKTLAIIGVVGSIISGIIGSILFNTRWSTGINALWKCVLSVLVSIGFAIGFGIAMGIVIIAVSAFYYLLVGLFIIAIIVAFFSGS